MWAVSLLLLIFVPLIGWGIGSAICISEENKIVEEEKAKLEKRQSEINTELAKYDEEYLTLFEELIINHKDLDEESHNELKNKIKIVEEKRKKLLNEYNEVSQYLSSLYIDGYKAYKRKHNL